MRRTVMRVLVVDDIQSNRMLSARILEKRGHTVKTVVNGREAIEQLTEEDFDVVLMDLQMPVMDGYEATRIIRNRASRVRRHDIPVIAVSTVSECDGKKPCLEAGMNGYLAKPLRFAEFLETVERYAPEAQ
jgi:CheY-like chemotaxis protein